MPNQYQQPVIIQPQGQNTGPVPIYSGQKKSGFPGWGWCLVGGCGCFVVIGIISAIIFGTMIAALLSAGAEASRFVERVCDSVNEKGSIKNDISNSIASGSNLESNTLNLDRALTNCKTVNEVTGVNYSKDNGNEILSINFKMEYKDGSVKPYQLDLVKEGTEWKIKNIIQK